MKTLAFTLLLLCTTSFTQPKTQSDILEENINWLKTSYYNGDINEQDLLTIKYQLQWLKTNHP